MKRHLPNIASALLGLAFFMFGLNYFLNFIPMPAPPEGSRVIPFFQATGTSGFMAFVKGCEIIGAILVAIPKTRNWGAPSARSYRGQHPRLQCLRRWWHGGLATPSHCGIGPRCSPLVDWSPEILRSSQ